MVQQGQLHVRHTQILLDSPFLLPPPSLPLDIVRLQQLQPRTHRSTWYLAQKA